MFKCIFLGLPCRQFSFHFFDFFLKIQSNICIRLLLPVILLLQLIFNVWIFIHLCYSHLNYMEFLLFLNRILFFFESCWKVWLSCERVKDQGHLYFFNLSRWIQVIFLPSLNNFAQLVANKSSRLDFVVVVEQKIDLLHLEFHTPAKQEIISFSIPFDFRVKVKVSEVLQTWKGQYKSSFCQV